ncbi:MAG: hypothetical protein IPL01_22135 [Acidobacteria bacterium]|nr:hypothetical protein [Acidobacteriota bacterium]
MVAKEDQEVEVIYYGGLRTDAKNNTPYLNWHSTTAGPIWIAPGASMLFKMPYDDLGPDWDIKIPYHYEWEDNVKKIIAAII